METLSRCPLCNTALTGTIYMQAYDHLVSGQTFNIEQCQACNFLFTNPRPAELEIGKYYQSADYISHTDESAGFQNYMYQKIKQLMLKNKLKLLNKHTKEKDKSLLDFGCGTGDFVLAAKTGGYSTTGFEPGIKASEIAKQKGVKVLSEKKELFSNNTSQRYDVITLWHVLEHLHDLQGMMRAFCHMLKPGALLVMAVPMANSADATFYQQRWAALDVPRHLYHFTPETMEQLCRPNGFKIIQRKGLPFDSFYISLLSEKQGKSKTAPIKALVQGLYSNIKALQKKYPWSSEIFVCQKTT